VIVWINGPYGGGKTATARLLVNLLPNAAVFDSEEVGFMLRHVLAPRRPVKDFQDWRPWRELVVASLVAVGEYLESDLIVPQTVLREDYWSEISAGLAAADVELRVFTVHSEADELERRIRSDREEPAAREWRLNRRQDYFAAASWLGAEAAIVDTTEKAPPQVARKIAELLDPDIGERAASTADLRSDS
jgi:hypothetical protein